MHYVGILLRVIVSVLCMPPVKIINRLIAMPPRFVRSTIKGPFTYFSSVGLYVVRTYLELGLQATKTSVLSMKWGSLARHVRNTRVKVTRGCKSPYLSQTQLRQSVFPRDRTSMQNGKTPHNAIRRCTVSDQVTYVYERLSSLISSHLLSRTGW